MSPLHDSGCRRNGKEARGADLLSLLGNLQHTSKIVKVDIQCPACERGLRIRPRPGKRVLSCPACKNDFHVTF